MIDATNAIFILDRRNHKTHFHIHFLDVERSSKSLDDFQSDTFALENDSLERKENDFWMMLNSRDRTFCQKQHEISQSKNPRLEAPDCYALKIGVWKTSAKTKH